MYGRKQFPLNGKLATNQKLDDQYKCKQCPSSKDSFIVDRDFIWTRTQCVHCVQNKPSVVYSRREMETVILPRTWHPFPPFQAESRTKNQRSSLRLLCPVRLATLRGVTNSQGHPPKPLRDDLEVDSAFDSGLDLMGPEGLDGIAPYLRTQWPTNHERTSMRVI